MKNGTLLSIFRVRFKSPENAYAPYVSMYYLFSKNKKAVLFQPFDTFTHKPPVYGLWSDLDHHIEAPETVAKYFGVKIEDAEKILEETKRWQDATRGVKIIESEDMLEYINGEMVKLKLPKYKSMEDVYAYTEEWWNAEEKKRD